jgi:hypothetical protein
MNKESKQQLHAARAPYAHSCHLLHIDSARVFKQQQSQAQQAASSK